MRVSLKNLDYVNSVRATEKQLNFIREIEGTLGYEFDFNNGTKTQLTILQSILMNIGHILTETIS